MANYSKRPHNFKDLTGKRFGRWKVVYKSDDYDRLLWVCECDCGTIKYVTSNSLRNGSQSCGCLRKENKGRKSSITPREKFYRQTFLRYINDARNRNLEFYLVYEQFLILATSKCYYCDKPPSNGTHIKYSGIDRVDNTKGYSFVNCVSCCKECNDAKKSITPKMIKKAYLFLYGV